METGALSDIVLPTVVKVASEHSEASESACTTCESSSRLRETQKMPSDTAAK